MEKILGYEGVKQLEHHFYRAYKMTEEDLLEAVCYSFVSWIMEHFPAQLIPRITVLCGPGNNGADGYYIAKLLAQENYDLKVIDASFEQQKSPLCRKKRGELKMHPNI